MGAPLHRLQCTKLRQRPGQHEEGLRAVLWPHCHWGSEVGCPVFTVSAEDREGRVGVEQSQVRESGGLWRTAAGQASLGKNSRCRGWEKGAAGARQALTMLARHPEVVSPGSSPGHTQPWPSPSGWGTTPVGISWERVPRGARSRQAEIKVELTAVFGREAGGPS